MWNRSNVRLQLTLQESLGTSPLVQHDVLKVLQVLRLPGKAYIRREQCEWWLANASLPVVAVCPRSVVLSTATLVP